MVEDKTISDKDYIYSLKAPIGHLPRFITGSTSTLFFHLQSPLRGFLTEDGEYLPEVSYAFQNLDKSLSEEINTSTRYQELEHHLKTQNFKDADNETDRVMLEVVGKKANQWLSLDNIKFFPCEDLKIINELWQKYSDGKFGFSIQRQIWMQYGGDLKEYNGKIYKLYATEIQWYENGWINYSDLNFTISAASGHLPYTAHLRHHIVELFSRCETCEL